MCIASFADIGLHDADCAFGFMPVVVPHIGGAGWVLMSLVLTASGICSLSLWPSVPELEHF